MTTPKRYHPALVAIHWISAVLIILSLLVGTFVLKWMPNDAAKIPSLAIHMTTGLIILVLTVARVVVRLLTKKPAPATAGNKILDTIGVLTHYLLYLGALGMGISGLGLSMSAGLAQSVFAKIGSLPPDFYVYPMRYGHGFTANAMLALVLLHIGAALYHQVIRKDNLMTRMSFKKD
jgi:cytochrome b561